MKSVRTIQFCFTKVMCCKLALLLFVGELVPHWLCVVGLISLVC